MNPTPFPHPQPLSMDAHTQCPYGPDSSRHSSLNQLSPFVTDSPFPQYPLVDERPCIEESAFSQTVREIEDQFYATFPAAKQASNHHHWTMIQNRQSNPQDAVFCYTLPESGYHFETVNDPCRSAAAVGLHPAYDNIDFGSMAASPSSDLRDVKVVGIATDGCMKQSGNSHIQPLRGPLSVSNAPFTETPNLPFQVPAALLVPSQNHPLNPEQQYYDQFPELQVCEEPIMDSLSPSHPSRNNSHCRQGRRMSVPYTNHYCTPVGAPYHQDQYMSKPSRYNHYHDDHRHHYVRSSSYPHAVVDDTRSHPMGWAYPRSPSPYDSPPSKRSVEKKPPLACLFCRARKIACGPPVEGSTDKTCNQCHRRSLKCEYPAESRRGMRKKDSAPSNLNVDGPKVFLTKVKH